MKNYCRVLHLRRQKTGGEGGNSYQYRNDLVVNIKDAKVIVEMNNNDTAHIRERNISYMMRTREDRKEKDIYNQTILVNLNNYCYEEDEKVRRDIALFDSDGNLYTNTLVIIDIYLPNIKKKCYTKGMKALSEMERFLLIGIEQDIKSALEYVGEDIVMKEFMKESETKSYDDDLREAYNKEEALKDQFYRDGMREGREEGYKENNLEIAKKMLKANESVDKIMLYTSLSEKELAKLKEAL